ncbi:MAG: hypothetical protein OEU09_24735 [Rhodospirillales bacterium]|nr:hypothetical protein [Rhodospirillales bacterium]
MPRAPREEDRDEKGRSERIPLGTPQSKLAVPERAEFYRRWINDTPGRIQRAEQAGYSFVADMTQEKDEEGNLTAMSALVGSKEDGSPLYAFLMEIPLELYNEDQKAKQKPLDEFDDALRRGNIRGADERDNSAFYVPEEGISVRND